MFIFVDVMETFPRPSEIFHLLSVCFRRRGVLLQRLPHADVAAPPDGHSGLRWNSLLLHGGEDAELLYGCAGILEEEKNVSLSWFSGTDTEALLQFLDGRFLNLHNNALNVRYISDDFYMRIAFWIKPLHTSLSTSKPRWFLAHCNDPTLHSDQC